MQESSSDEVMPGAPCITSSLLGQAVMKWMDAAQSPTVVPLSGKGLDAMQRLIAVMDEVRSPNGGWVAEVPQTPENLLPYVTEEAFDLLEALQSLSNSSAEVIDEPSTSPFQPDYCSMQELVPWMLWAIARSTYEGMQLIEGIPVKATESDQTWQSGVLRLAIALHFHNPDRSWTFDLVTHQLQPTLIDPSVKLQPLHSTTDSPLAHEILAGEWLQRVTQQIQLATPSLYPFLSGIATELLTPQDQWRSGMIQIKLGFEFTSTAERGDRAIPSNDFAVDPNAELSSCSADPQASKVLRSLIQFTDPDWSKNYWAIVNRQHLAATLTRLQLTEPDGEINLSPSTSALDLVRVADITVQQLRQSSALVSCNIPHQIWNLGELNQRLLWCVSRGANEVMQLMGGISAQVLQPNQYWQAGVLRLSVTLAIQTPELELQLDLVTGHMAQSQAVSEQAIVQSSQTHWCQMPTLVKRLMSQVMQNIQRATPEIQLLLNGTDVNLQLDDEVWQPGTLQLNTHLEFVADRASL